MLKLVEWMCYILNVIIIDEHIYHNQLLFAFMQPLESAFFF